MKTDLPTGPGPEKNFPPPIPLGEGLAPETPRGRHLGSQAENLLITAGLAFMVILPVAEIALRAIFQKSFFGSSTLVQQLTLLVGMVGGAIATREGRLLALSPSSRFPEAGGY